MGERQSESTSNQDHKDEPAGKPNESGQGSVSEQDSDAAEREQDRQLETGEENPA